MEHQLDFGFWTYNQNQSRFWWSQGVGRIIGVGEHTENDCFLNCFKSDDRSRILERLESDMPEAWSDTFLIETADQNEKWVRLDVFPTADGSKFKFRCTFQDISENHESKAFLDSLLSNLPKQVIYSDDNENVLFVNRDDIVPCDGDGSKLSQYFPKSFLDQLRVNLLNSKRTRLPVQIEFSQSYSEERYYRASISPVFIKNNLSGYICLVSDETSRVKDEKELEAQRNMAIQASRLASIGELAAGVGHEINNPLTIVSFALTQVRRKIKIDSNNIEMVEYLDKADMALDRAKAIASDLKKYSRADSLELDSIDME